MSHWAEPMIGMPWVAGQNDCWAFARRIWTERFGWDVPPVVVDAQSQRERRAAFSVNPTLAGWFEVMAPREGDAVLMGRSARPCHVGIWIDPADDPAGILHSVEQSGVIFTEPSRLAALSWRILGFYRWADAG